ncbi:diguanylate cyclase domain-containing protein [Methylophaga lonarensis]|uniref:diguanylate cyclase domain-containing protein n=1 Tax=Methylophaga lonarensis TaxID=999151 RepID=UPI003D2D5622
MREIIRKYRHFLLPLSMVLVFDLSLLAMNYVISAQLEVSSVNINIAGRQRMLSQKMTKSVMLIHYQHAQGLSSEHSFDELREAVFLFDQTLNAFYQGGKATSAAGEAIRVDKQVTSNISQTLSKAQEIWQPLFTELNLLLSDETYLPSVVSRLSQDNLLLLDLMNTLTNQLEDDARRSTYLLRGLQTIIVLMILLSFAMAIHRLIRRDQYYTNLMEKSSDIVLGINAGSGLITFISASVKVLLGRDEKYYLDHPLEQLFDPASVEYIEKLIALINADKSLPEYRCEVGLKGINGDIIIAEMLMQVAPSEDGCSMELSADIRDISERKLREQKLSDMAHKDALTGLPNRSMLTQMAEQAIHHARMQAQSLAVMFIDLDEFKAVNDAYGHAVGDRLLIEVAKRIDGLVRASDHVARISGDEFVVLLTGTTLKSDIQRIGHKIIQALSEPVVIDGHQCLIGASVGIARFPDDGNDFESLLKAADNVMYAVKHNGKNAVAFAC